MINRIMHLPLLPLLATIALSNLALSTVLLMAVVEDQSGTRNITIGYQR